MFTSIKLIMGFSLKPERLKLGIIGVHKTFYRQHTNFPNESYDRKSIEFNIKEKLDSIKAAYEDGFTCYKLNVCTFCSTNHCNSLQLFVNKKTGNFICHKCKIYGSWPTIDKMYHFSRNELDKLELLRGSLSYDFTLNWKQQANSLCDLWDLKDEEFEVVLRGFNLPKLSKQNFKKLDVKVNGERNLIFFPLYCNGIVVGYRNLDLFGNSFTFPKTDCPGVLTLNREKETSSVILVAEIADFIALATSRLTDEVICLPYGIKTLPQNILPLFERYEKIIFWLGDQSGAWHSSIQFGKKLIEKRCYLIRPTDNQMSASKAVENGENIGKIISKAKPIWHQFVTTFASLREDVIAEIQNVTEVSGVSWKRFPQLTKILKGHRRGELTILTGPTGSGKTTFLSEYSLDLAMQGVNTLWGSFEIKNSRLARTMLQQFAGFPLTPDNLELVNHWANKFENLPIYFLTFHGQHSIDAVMNAVEHCSYTYDIAHVLIDNIQFMMDISTDANKYLNRFWGQDLILQSFRRFATGSNCHVTLVIHPRKEMEGTHLGMNSIFGTAKAAQEADNIMIVQENPIKGKKFLQICKNRFSGDLGRMSLEFDKESLRFSKKKESSAADKYRTNSTEDEISSFEDTM